MSFTVYPSTTGGGGGDYLPLAGGTMDNGAEIAFDNYSKIRQNPDGNGLDQVCSIDYVHRWKDGSLYIMNQSGGIRSVQYGLSGEPDSSFDETQGYLIGSRFIKDDGTIFECTDNAEADAVWVEVVLGVTDHGALTGLADDDHPQYAKAVFPATTLTYAATLTPNCNDGLYRKVTMTGNLTVNAPTNAQDGMIWRGRFRAHNNTYNLTFNAAIKIPTGVIYEPTVVSGSSRVIHLEYDGTRWVMVRNLEFTA